MKSDLPGAFPIEEELTYERFIELLEEDNYIAWYFSRFNMSFGCHGKDIGAVLVVTELRGTVYQFDTWQEAFDCLSETVNMRAAVRIPTSVVEGYKPDPITKAIVDLVLARHPMYRKAR